MLHSVSKFEGPFIAVGIKKANGHRAHSSWMALPTGCTVIIKLVTDAMLLGQCMSSWNLWDLGKRTLTSGQIVLGAHPLVPVVHLHGGRVGTGILLLGDKLIAGVTAHRDTLLVLVAGRLSV